jgi:hypothetical protein
MTPTASAGAPPLARFLSAFAALLTLCGLLAAVAAANPAPQTVPGDALDPRTYAPGSKAFLALYAIGVQKYACQANGTWLFTDPEATLYKNDDARRAVGTHFLNFATGRPVWRFQDGSAVEAARRVSVPGAAGAIPWLLLQTAATTAGDEGRLLRTTWVQRLNTTGGVAPTSACAPGETKAVPYTADYVFWKVGAAD